MPPGDELDNSQRRSIQLAIAGAESVSGRRFSVYVGDSTDSPREYAIARHARLADAHDAVLVLVDPARRTLEVVTGQDVRRVLDDSAVALAALGMQGAFAAGDLTGGIVHGLQQLAEHARAPRSLHTR